MYNSEGVMDAIDEGLVIALVEGLVGGVMAGGEVEQMFSIATSVVLM